MKLIIFDCDGTLVDSQHGIVAAMNGAFADNGLATLSAPEILSTVGLSLPLAFQRLLPDADVDMLAAVTEHYRTRSGAQRREAAHHEPFYPGMRELVEDLATGNDVLLGIATGKSVRGVNALLERTGLGGRFHTIQTADTHPSKPDPSMIQAAMAETGAESHQTIMVGDTTFDIEMAHRAGVHAIAVAWGYHPVATLKAVGAHGIADDAAGLRGLIAARFDRLDRESMEQRPA